MCQSVLVISFITFLQKERHFSDNTLRAYFGDLEQYYANVLGDNSGDGDPRILQATPNDIQAYHASLTSQGYNTATIARKVASLRSFYKWLVRIGKISINPALGLKTPKRSKPVRALVTVSQIMRLLAAPDVTTLLGARDAAMLELMISTGMKISELVELNKDDFDDTGEIPQLVVNSKRQRVIPLIGGAVQSLRRYLNLREQSRFGTCEALFVNNQGARLSGRSVRRSLELHFVSVGISLQVRPYALRHSYAEHLVRNGADPAQVQKMLGAKDLQNIRTTYSSSPKTKVITPLA